MNLRNDWGVIPASAAEFSTGEPLVVVSVSNEVMNPLNHIILVGMLFVMAATSSRAQEQERVAWGSPIGGLRLGVADNRRPSADEPVIEVWFENVGNADFMLNLGAMLGNGRTMEPYAIVLRVTKAGGQMTAYRWGGFVYRVGGRLDDFIVSLRTGSRHMVLAPIDGFVSTSGEHLRLTAGRYTLATTYGGVAAQLLNSDTPGIATFNFWHGSLESGAMMLTSSR